MTIEVTDAMEQAFIDGAYNEGQQVTASVAAGLEAVLALIDPVPDDVQIITDATGTVWQRERHDLMVWADLLAKDWRWRTARWIDERYGPITWEGKAAGPASECIAFDRDEDSVFGHCCCGHSTDQHAGTLGPCEACAEQGQPVT